MTEESVLPALARGARFFGGLAAFAFLGVACFLGVFFRGSFAGSLEISGNLRGRNIGLIGSTCGDSSLV